MFNWTVESAATAHTILRWAVLVFIFLSAVAGGLAIKVGNIKDRLTEQKQVREQRKLEERIKQEAEDAAAEREKRLRAQLAKTEKELSDVKVKQAKQAPRNLSAEQRRIITGALQPYTNQGISVTKLGDAEARAYAEQIINVLAAAGWKLSISDSGGITPPVYGIFCTIADPEQPSPAAGALLSAFKSAGILVSMKRGGDIHSISLLIGLKPVDLSK